MENENTQQEEPMVEFELDEEVRRQLQSGQEEPAEEPRGFSL